MGNYTFIWTSTESNTNPWHRFLFHAGDALGHDNRWEKTYGLPARCLKNIGGAQIVYSALAPKGLVATVGVRPNPYKRAALHDNRTQVYDHKLLFYNLPPQAKVTILDVSGQVIDVINFASSDASKGSFFWDMFSKDGIEVASGVYVYVVESPNNSMVGYFSILR